MARRSAAAADEEAVLRALSAQAEQSRQALAETADALARTISARATVPLRRVALIALPAVIVVTIGAAYLIRRRPR